MPRVLLLATKDTIAYSTRPGHEAVASGAQLLAKIGPTAADVAVEDVLTEPSWDVSPASMLTLARRARDAIRDDGFDGVVIAYGIDTLEETAFLVDLLAGANGPIVLTAATRPLDDPLTDGPRNLASSIVAAATLKEAGAVVCLDGELHAARWFPRFAAPPLGRVVGARVELLASPPPRPPEPSPGEPETNVALIRTYPGIGSALLNTVVDAGARGVVLEGTGMGNVPASLLAAISDLTEWDIPVVITSRRQERRVRLESDGLAGKVGAIDVPHLTAGKAQVALMVALGSVGGVRIVRDWFRRL